MLIIFIKCVNIVNNIEFEKYIQIAKYGKENMIYLRIKCIIKK